MAHFRLQSNSLDGTFETCLVIKKHLSHYFDVVQDKIFRPFKS